jgi:enoyl-CoA hydratase/carnithine racemase
MQMDASNGHGLQRSHDDGLAVLTLAKPPRNLLDPDLMEALREAILEADADPDVEVIALTGTDDMFCGGLDIERNRPQPVRRVMIPKPSGEVCGCWGCRLRWIG